MDVKSVHQFLANDSYWTKGIPFDLVDKSLNNPFCVGAFINGTQFGFGRAVADEYTFGWLSDVSCRNFAKEEFQK